MMPRGKLARRTLIVRVDGYRCHDVQGALVPISLLKNQDAATRAKLLRLPTGLTIDRWSVDLLVNAGEQMTLNSAELCRVRDDPGPALVMGLIPRRRLAAC